MIKDRGQKKLATRFCAVLGIVPFAEVLVRSSASLEDVPSDITDLDVLGVDIGRFGVSQKIIFDCKTANRQSGINRALWASGLKQYVNADAAFVIQMKDVPNSHRTAAAGFGVNIHSEDSFRRFASSLSQDFARDVTYLDDMDRWDDLVTIRKQNNALADLVFFITTQSALESSGPRGVRNGLSAIMKASGELDPAKPQHRMIFGTYLSSFLLHIVYSTSDLRNMFEFGMDHAQFEKLLRYFIWEGRENYELRRKLRRALVERGSPSGEHSDASFDLPEWPRLVELFRLFLEAPEALASLPLVAKELAFRVTSSPISPRPDADSRIVSLFTENNRARQFMFAAASYICAAAGLPRDFSRRLEGEVNALLV
jgi:hypothetical protein